MPQDNRDLRLQDWAWSRFGGPVMLVTRTGGSKVILSAFKNGRQVGLCVRKSLDDGQLIEVTANHPIARLLEQVPKLYNLCLLTAEGNDPALLQETAKLLVELIGDWEETTSDAAD